MSDEKTPNEEEGARGCLGIMILVLVVALVVLVLACVARLRPDLNIFSGLRETFQEATMFEADDSVHEQWTQQPQQTTPVHSETMRVVTRSAVLAEPRMDAEELATLTPGTEVSVLGRDGRFSILDMEEKVGYLLSDCLREPGAYLVVIDAGHQQKPDYDKEPIGPGATEEKAKVTSGAQGVATGIEEYELNLQVARRLSRILEERGYQVKMIRTKHNVNISNSERATVANELYADAFIRIHANADEDSAVTGMMTVCQTKENPYNGDLWEDSFRLAQSILDEMVSATGGKKQSVWQTDTMSGINWCRVPAVIVEMGYLSNPKEDRLMSTEDYQEKLAEGMANGIDAFFD